MTSDTVLFCAKYLAERGYKAEDFDVLVRQSRKLKSDYNLVKKEPTSFFTELAEKLRELWPAGEKEGKYPWRDSVPNIRKRLMEMWFTRFKDKSYTMDQCLAAARHYLAQFDNDVTYMKILKYFILKQREIKDENGKITRYDESVLADILESGEYVTEMEVNMDNISEGEGILI